MHPIYHILNGDGLFAQFPTNILGNRIIMRECLIEGVPAYDSWDEFFSLRAAFITARYPEFSADFYYQKVVCEIQKLGVIENCAEINLWFEDDLFCQANLWFLLHFLCHNQRAQSLFLVRPIGGHEYSFTTMSQAQLIGAYGDKISISLDALSQFSALWQAYVCCDFKKMHLVASELKAEFPCVLPAVIAHQDRFPQDGSLGRPEKTILKIMDEKKTADFSLIFKEFCLREPIYGFGDLQLRYLYNRLIKKTEFNYTQCLRES